MRRRPTEKIAISRSETTTLMFSASRARSIVRLKLCAFLAALLLTLSACRQHHFTATVFEDVEPAPPVRGQNYDGSTFELAHLKGDTVLLFFGYTFCPDVCPLTMMELAEAKRALARDAPALAAGLQLVFVTIDPQRDRLARIEPYVKAFHPQFYGVRVPETALDALKPAYGLFVEPPDGSSLADDYYLLDHTSRVFLIDRKGNWLGLFSSEVTADELAADLKALLR